MSDVRIPTDPYLDLEYRRAAEDCLEPLAEAGDTLHDYVVGTAALLAQGADAVDLLDAVNALTTAQRDVRRAHWHLIEAMTDPRARLPDPLEAAAAVDAAAGGRTG